MAAFDFPSSPSVNQTYTANGVTWKWNGTMWMRVSGAGYLEKIEEGNSKIEVDDSGSGNVTVTTDGTERLRITSTGLVGIGTASPEEELSIQLDSSSDGPTLRLRNANGGNGTYTGRISTGDVYGTFFAGINFLKHDSNDGEIRLRTKVDGTNTDVVTIVDGKVGINQASPEAMLQVDYDYANSEVGLRLRAASGSGTKTWQLSEINGNAGVFTIRNATNAQNILNIDGVNQRVGVNDSTPDATLSVGGSTAFIDIGEAGGNRGKIGYSSNDLYFGTSSSSGAFIFKTNVTSTDNPASSGTDRIRIDSNGRQYHYTDGSLRMHLNATGLGVNTSTITGGRIIHAHNTGTGSAYFQSTNSNTGEGSSSGALYGVSGTTCYAPWNYINGPVVFATNSSEKMRIHATGEVTKSSQPLAIIGTTQNNWSPSVGDVLPFNYSNTNRGNHYNTSNYTFTCPVTGDYMVILRLSRKGWTGDVELAKNNSQYVKLELRETGRNNSSAADWQAWCYDFIVPCAANDTLKWKAPSVNTGTGGGNYLLDGYNHIYYDSVTYYLMG